MKHSLAALAMVISVGCHSHPPQVEDAHALTEQTDTTQGLSLARQLDNPALHQVDGPRRIEVEFYGRTFSYPEGEYRPLLRPYFSLIAQVKNYTDHLGMFVSNNYAQFEPPQSERRLFWLFITPSDHIPMTEPTRVQVRENGANRCDPPCHLANDGIDNLLDEQEYYDGQGFHTHRREIVNFSMGANVTEEFLAQSAIVNISTLFHEEFHHDRSMNQTHFDSYVEEGLATAFGRVMAVHFIEDHLEQNVMLDYGMIQEARDRIQTRQDYSEFINRYVMELRSIYDGDLPIAQMQLQRDACLARAEEERTSVNNALLWHEHAYTMLYPLAADIGLHCSRDEFVEIMRDTPAHLDEAVFYLESNLARLTRSSDRSSP